MPRRERDDTARAFAMGEAQPPRARAIGDAVGGYLLYQIRYHFYCQSQKEREQGQHALAEAKNDALDEMRSLSCIAAERAHLMMARAQSMSRKFRRIIRRCYA